MKILFQGDSITDAFRKPEELNPAFQLGNGYAFLAAAHLGAKYPERNFEFFNRGISGHTLQDLRDRWDRDALALDCDVVSLLVGVNETIQAMKHGKDLGDERFEESYSFLLDSLIGKKSSIRFILLEPFLLEVGEVTPVWQAHLKKRQSIIDGIARGRGLPLIPLQRVFDEASMRAPASYWSYDGIHPTHAGFQLIADAWLKVIAENASARPDFLTLAAQPSRGAGLPSECLQSSRSNGPLDAIR